MDRSEWKSFRAESSYTSTGHQVIKRKAKAAGVEKALSLPIIKTHMRKWAAKMDADQFIDHLQANRYELRPGKKAGIWRLYGHGHDLGAIDRLSGIKRHKIDEIMVKKYNRTSSHKDRSGKFRR